MQLSMRTDYALRALFTLVEAYGRGPVPVRELARRNDVPRPFLEQIMLEMKKQGWVESVPGKAGGYLLGRQPGEITMGEVVRYFDGYLAPIACVSVTDHRRCTQESFCRFRRLFLDIRNHVARVMDRSTLADVFGQSPVRNSEVLPPGFMDGAGI